MTAPETSSDSAPDSVPTSATKSGDTTRTSWMPRPIPALPPMPPMLRWLVRRTLLTFLVVLGAASVAFFALHLVPGDPVRALLGANNPSPELVDQVRHELGYDRPLVVQYGMFLADLFQGDLGRSYQLQQPVTELIGGQLGATVQLALASFVLALVVATLLAVATAGRRPWLRRLSSGFELVAASSPTFWTGVLLLTFLSFKVHAFPAFGGTGVEGLVLPAVTLALSLVGVLAQVIRESMERSLSEPYVVSARARGTGETGIRVRHTLRHTLVPVITLSGWAVGALLSGAVVVETVFSRQGVGRLMATAIASRDLPVVTGVVVVSALAFSIINLAVDALYRVVDPRMQAVAA